jgi:hypothetical protein
MSIEYRIRILAGSLILTLLALTIWVSPYWMILAAFVGANMFQSAFTKFCLAEIIMRKIFRE